MEKLNIFWFRRDLRLHDNTGLFHALSSELNVLPIFIFDTQILDELPENDARVTFIFNTLQRLRKELEDHYNSSIAFYYGKPKDIFSSLVKTYDVNAVYTNRDYEPYATDRDQEIEQLLLSQGIEFRTFKDHVIFEKNEVVKNDGKPYLVYTPYMKKWKKAFSEIELKPYPSDDKLDNCVSNTELPNITLEEMGFKLSNIKVKQYNTSDELLKKYNKTRDLPSIEGTSRLSPYLRFGLVGYRQLIDTACSVEDETYLNELIWREFYAMILYAYPDSSYKAFKEKYDRIQWRNNKEDFDKWKNGQTGYPIVDAGMRQLNQTGWMHNRVRMIVGSFLCKHLLIDWRWGEAYFAKKLLDYDMASNVGGWQWVAGSGVDAAPYFRVFNPYTQTDKFDKERKYIKKWVPEFESSSYPKPMVEHKFARERCLETYKYGLNA